ncbi:hypothetical protein CBS76997_11281 [Aspergillus niger]|uniref:Zn(2)-C6 fungal-type domain-containing protein n=1 Tax=Aspergillus niger TaxID=5061 RepID=A0A9W6EGK3_ASPNG|nr:hypothetical protein CBS13152_11248 [Aspergillus niger]KAI2868880.1 hypothetical protein CBS11852_11298 [Aspergillus niger]KAI2947537.1 hypothetical protein CBS147323_11168 [Aspergillus niger]KAI3033491.1 hypothetical protein CBS76997_11281 [Aspergillus niger]GLA56200.1 hypothetical protein AnigIFM63604_005549 [Aspergillus niger]
MDKQPLQPPLEVNYTPGAGNEWRTDTHVSRIAPSGEGGPVSVATLFRQHQEDASVTESVQDFQDIVEAPTKREMDRACESCFRRKVKCSRICPCEECQRRGNNCVPRSRLDRRKETIILTTPTGARAKPPQNGNIGADQPSRELLRIYEILASESTERHQRGVSNLSHASDATIPCDNIAKHGPPLTCFANVTSREGWNMVRDNCDSGPPCETSANTGWRAPCNAFIPPHSYMSTENLTGEPMPNPWYKETGLQTALLEPFSGWNRLQSRYLIGSGNNVFSHPPWQAAGRPFGGEAEQPRHSSRSGAMLICGAHSQEQYPPGPSFGPPELVPSSVAVGLPFIPETASPCFPYFPREQQVEVGSLALPTESPMLSTPWDPLATIPAELHIADIRSRSLHQQPSAPFPIQNNESLVAPWLHNAMEYHGTGVRQSGNVGANSQELSRDVTVPEESPRR